MQLIDCQNESILLPQVEVAATAWQRFRGLMFRRQFEEGFGLWLEPCRSVHTMWMRVAVDLYFVDRDGVVVEYRAKVSPWSIVIPATRCHAVLEVPDPVQPIQVGAKVCLRG
jgi:uncharacterized membrane protein (UPF0127 family)